MYFEIVHKFINNNCIHEILIHENKKDIKYKHKYVFLCNSNEYSKFDNISEKINDNYIDLYSYEYAPETDYIIVFRFSVRFFFKSSCFFCIFLRIVLFRVHV